MIDGQRTVLSVRELSELPVGSVVLWQEGGESEVAITRDDDWIGHTASDYWNLDFDRVQFPATVIYVPGEGDRG